MRRKDQKLQWPMALAGLCLGLTFAMQAARGECLSPSAAAGATSTTVYRCQEADSSGGQLPVIVNPEQGTVVERGSANIPWFEPKPTKTADPIETAKKPLEKKRVEKPVDLSEKPVELSKKPAEVELPKKPVEKVVKPVETEPAPAAKAEAKPVKPKTKKTAKTKRSKTKLTKTKRTKAKLAKAKRSKTTKAKAKAKTETAQTEIPNEVPKAEPAKSDDKVIVWTKKDVSVGGRIKNWLGF